MPFIRQYSAEQPAREDVDALPGAVAIEFGTSWCGHCQAAQPLLEQALADVPGLLHLKVEDGPGRPLGRSFRVKLWPTLILMRDGQEVARLVRPHDREELQRAVQQVAPAA